MNPTPDTKGDILIVDDTPANIKILITALADQGYQVRAALSGEAALESIQVSLPELILLDIKMPEMNGYEVSRQLKSEEKTRDIPIIFLSALNDTEDIIEAFNSGGVDYISKPFNLREVLKRVEAQITLVHQRQYIEMLNSMKNQFIDAATHDLRNTLSFMVVYTNLLEKEVETVENNENLIKLIDPIKQAHDRILKLITSMLDLAELKTEFVISLSSQSVNEMLSKSWQSFDLLAAQKQIDFILTPLTEDCLILADPNYMQRALENLIVNALKYTLEGGRVEIRAEHTDGKIYIQVSDTGLGISEEALPYVFDEFYRAEGVQNSEIAGTGLGLSIVKSIIDQHDGEVTVESSFGEGSVFSIILPILEEFGD